MPIFNAEKHLKFSLNSIVNQTIGLKNLQVILVNDCSNDDSKLIIDEYCDKYDNFLAIDLEENIGGAYGPRNIGLKYATGEYLMFLDSDDSYELNACEILYNKISSSEFDNLDIVFARYKRIYPNFDNNTKDIVLKSYSPYKDNIVKYKEDIIENPNFSKFTSFLWKIFFIRLIYGKKKKESSNEIYLKNINEDSNILKILPSIWTRIYKRDFIINNNIEFPHFISGEDLNFVIKSYLNADGILFLNDVFVNNYYMRDSEEDKSITKEISFKLIYDSLKSYKYCADLCNDYNFKHSDIILNPFLLNWINIFSNFEGSLEEKEKLLKLAKEMKKEYSKKFKAKLLISLVIFIINRSKTKKT